MSGGIAIESHPSWVCGLKHHEGGSRIMENDVTPFVGVWIETSAALCLLGSAAVTPFVGVWIETVHYLYA